jgi:Ni/Co efflux regulator RcnB
MNRYVIAAVMAGMALTADGAMAAPDDHRDDARPAAHVDHPEWRQGARIAPSDWSRGQQVDYRSHHLRAPPRGYEWRQVDGNYVLAAVATGVIASVIASGG